MHSEMHRKSRPEFANLVFLCYFVIMGKYTANELKRKKAAVFLDDILVKLPPGGRLPGLRKLIATSGVGRVTIERELRDLAAAGRVGVHSRSGWFRMPDAPDTAKIWVLHTANYPVMGIGFVGALFAALGELAAARMLHYSVTGYNGMNEHDIGMLLAENGIQNVFLFGATERSFAEFISSRVLRCVELLPRHAGALGPEVRDSCEMTALQLDCLLRRGYRKIGYIHQIESDWSMCPVQRQRLFDFYRIMAENGLRVMPEWVFFCTYDWEKFNRRMYRMMNSPSPPEAVIVPGSSLEFVYRYCTNNGIRVGTELAIMGCDNIEPELSPRATTVTNTPREIAELAWEVMDAALRGEVLQKVPALRIVTGESVRFSPFAITDSGAQDNHVPATAAAARRPSRG